VEEHTRKHNYKLKLPATIRLQPMLHVKNLRPCYTTSLQQVVMVITITKSDDEEIDISHICVVN
jgi:hypothetical protein